MEREEPSRPFEQVAADFFTWGNRDYLAYVDRATRWVEVFFQQDWCEHERNHALDIEILC